MDEQRSSRRNVCHGWKHVVAEGEAHSAHTWLNASSKLKQRPNPVFTSSRIQQKKCVSRPDSGSSIRKLGGVHTEITSASRFGSMRGGPARHGARGGRSRSLEKKRLKKLSCSHQEGRASERKHRHQFMEGGVTVWFSSMSQHTAATSLELDLIFHLESTRPANSRPAHLGAVLFLERFSSFKLCSMVK
ncbi:hypothetical protein LR48_Vigan06g090300 [Vigna angularis]|uniref:Uncharacterized protein n=1 Tax=Phaseolus angularis TaxID=3914 RepID=A0A0L9USQ0_PHAAN|nr:hypothetical protein LR48_Vigan06g090300 [Vigna angularis]